MARTLSIFRCGSFVQPALWLQAAPRILGMSETSSATTKVPVVAVPWENSPDAGERRRADLVTAAAPICHRGRAVLADDRGAVLWRTGDMPEGEREGALIRDPADGKIIGRIE